MLSKCGVNCWVLFGGTPRLKAALLAGDGVCGVPFPLSAHKETLCVNFPEKTNHVLSIYTAGSDSTPQTPQGASFQGNLRGVGSNLTPHSTPHMRLHNGQQ